MADDPLIECLVCGRPTHLAVLCPACEHDKYFSLLITGSYYGRVPLGADMPVDVDPLLLALSEDDEREDELWDMTRRE